jgi:anthranilate phosphoribosyltransferase
MHPFAPFIRKIARGPTLGKPLGIDQAEEAMAMVLDGRVEPVQLGALLMVLRYRTETADELAGFVRAARARITVPSAGTTDLDWPSYADRHKQLPYFLLAARLLAGDGVRVLIHGVAGEGEATTPKALGALGIPLAGSADEAARHLDHANLAYLPLEVMLPGLAALFDLRPLLGLRSPVNSLARELNPFAAPAQIQGVFHPNYAPLHAGTALALGQPRAVVFKGGGGEAQRNPEKPCRTIAAENGATREEVWPALVSDEPYPWRKEPLDPARIQALWNGEWHAPGPEAAVVGTTSIALLLLGRATSMAAAEDRADELWRHRLEIRRAA